MFRRSKLGAAVVAVAWLSLGSSSTHAEKPTNVPFSMRGVQLGITIDEFRQAAIPNDGDHYIDLMSYCSTDDILSTISVRIDREDRRDGIVNCAWYSRNKSEGGAYGSHPINIGTGEGQATFQFLPDSGGTPRLFRIRFGANGDYYAGIYDALARGYGPPTTIIEPFQTKSGSEFTSATSVWDNGQSTITLTERCGHLERSCLVYDHSALVKSYDAILERRAAAAATKL